MDLSGMISQVEREFPDYGWLVRQLPERRGGGYFANITSPDFDASQVPYTGSIHTATGPTPEAALALSLEKVRLGEPDPRDDRRVQP